MDVVINMDRTRLLTELEESQKIVREMVLDSYQDMVDGKGRNYKEFFTELEGRYKNANVCGE
ncbi:MAG: hypothetical protein IJD40_04485 [Lachnospiraceae bacterium]|nr:hypothetical protein [Lachnospiraceae bacterium]